jgi:hypothetical protein
LRDARETPILIGEIVGGDDEERVRYRGSLKLA